MSTITAKTSVITDYVSETLDERILSSKKPLVIKGLVNHWKLVAEGKQSDSCAMSYPSVACIGSPEIQGRFFYDALGTQLNFDTQQMKIDEVLDLIQAGFGENNPTSYYIASNVIDTHFPEFRKENDIVIPRPVADYPLEDVRV